MGRGVAPSVVSVSDGSRDSAMGSGRVANVRPVGFNPMGAGVEAPAMEGHARGPAGVHDLAELLIQAIAGVAGGGPGPASATVRQTLYGDPGYPEWDGNALTLH